MKIKKSDVLVLENVFKGMLEERLNPELAYKIASNIVSISECAEKIRSSWKPADGYDVYEEERKTILDSIGAPDQQGRYSFSPEQAIQFKDKEEALNEKHKDVIELQKSYGEKFDKMLEKKEDVDVEKINMKDLTADIEPAKLVVMMQAGILVKDGNK